MTTLLNSAFKKITDLPQTEQNIFARFIIDEIESEKKWDDSFSMSEELLEDMAQEALNDFNQNKTSELNIESL